MKPRRFPLACISGLVLAASALRLSAGPESQAIQAYTEAGSAASSITVRWAPSADATPLGYTVQRKVAGADLWGPATALPGTALSFTDTEVSPGVAYEYQIVKTQPTYTGYGYAQGAVDLPAVEDRGVLVLLVDNTHATALAPELARLREDLLGEGWQVVRYDVAPDLPPPAVKSLVLAACRDFPDRVRSVLLIGHVAVPYSGKLAPDGHPEHVGAWPADVYYGDIDGVWTDETVDFTQTANSDPADCARLSNVPGDGKFDQSLPPSRIELSVGRVDFSNLPVFAESETALLRRYLDKNHAYRRGLVAVERRALAADYFGMMAFGECFSVGAYSAFSSLVGPDHITNLNATQPGLTNVWLPALSAGSHLLAFGAGPGTYDGAQGVATSAGFASSAPQAVFTFLVGSYFGDFDTRNNLLRASLAARGLGLAAGWSGRPHWFLHPMATGGTIGDAALLTQNNNDAYRATVNVFPNRVHIALLGDPTLVMRPLRAPTDLRLAADAGAVALTWSPSPDADLGYHVFRAASPDHAFTRLTTQPVVATSFVDPAPAGESAVYLVRPLRLESGTGGTYHNLGPGVIASLAAASTDLAPPTVLLSSPAAGDTLVGVAMFSARAWDDVAVASVQFLVDGAPVGPAVSTPPYTMNWDSMNVANGEHLVSALATDAAGRSRLAPEIAVVVNNPGAITIDGGDRLWIDDDPPAGSIATTASGSPWTWISDAPAPYSGERAFQTGPASAVAENRLDLPAGLGVVKNDTLFMMVWLDPANPPAELRVSWRTGSGAEGAASWGAKLIPTPKRASVRSLGALPAAGKWVLMEIPADLVRLEGKTLKRLSFSTYGGRVAWDFVGVAAGASRR